MAYPKAPLKQADLTRYAKAMRAAGVEEFRVEIEPTGKIVIIAAPDRSGSEENDWD